MWRISGLSCWISRGETSRSGFTSTLSITASNTFSRIPYRCPTSTITTWPLRYLLDLSPSRMVAVLRPWRSWSATTAEEKLRAFTGVGIISAARRLPRSRAPSLRYCRTTVRRPRVIYWVVFLDALLMFAIVPLLPQYARELDLSKTQAGLAVGAYSGAVLLASPVV